MTLSSFERTRNALLCAEDRCIAHLNELVFQTQPAWDEIRQGFCLVDELKLSHYLALNEFVAHPNRFPVRSMSEMLKHSATTLSESLLIMEEILRHNHSRS
jgi:hypothetical protein